MIPLLARKLSSSQMDQSSISVRENNAFACFRFHASPFARAWRDESTASTRKHIVRKRLPNRDFYYSAQRIWPHQREREKLDKPRK